MSNVKANVSGVTIIEQRILDYLSSRNSIDVGGLAPNEVPIADGDGLDSLGIVELSMLVGDEFGIEFEDDDFVTENFQTVGTLAQLIETKLAI